MIRGAHELEFLPSPRPKGFVRANVGQTKKEFSAFCMP